MAKEKEKEKIKSGQYEAMFLLPASFATEVDNALKIVRGIVERHQGNILVIKKWDERKLAYEIAAQKRGLYVICYFTAPGNAIAPILRDVDLSEQVLRAMVTDAGHLNAQEMAAVEPQPIQPREERPSWDRPSYDERPSGPPRGDRPPRRGDLPAEAYAKD